LTPVPNLSEQYSLNTDKFVVIAKARLTGEQPNHYSFLRMVRLAALSGRCAAIKTEAWTIFEASLKEAQEEMGRLSVLGFDQIILASPRREGVWEPDTLFRVFGILMRREARARLYKDDAAMRSLVEEARRVSIVPLEGDPSLGEEPPSQEALRIQRFEMYETGGFLNGHCLPLDLGDIFEGANGRQYLLLAQPCELMMRFNGRRSYDDRCGRTAALVDLIQCGVGEKPKPRWTEIPFYAEDNRYSAFVDFAKVHQVQLSVLDLCALNQTGVAEINLDGGCPSVVFEPLKKRYVILKRFYQTALTRYAELESRQVKAELKALALPIPCTTEQFKVNVNGQLISYELRRTGRVNQPRSGALLTLFAQHQSRAAFEHDLEGREEAATDKLRAEHDPDQ
jgi:hypothetical protein